MAKRSGNPIAAARVFVAFHAPCPNLLGRKLFAGQQNDVAIKDWFGHLEKRGDGGRVVMRVHGPLIGKPLVSTSRTASRLNSSVNVLRSFVPIDTSCYF